MTIRRIEKIVDGKVVQRAEPTKDGWYACLPKGTNMNPELFATLDEVAAYLRKNPEAGVRMNPGWSKISRQVHIDGTPR